MNWLKIIFFTFVVLASGGALERAAWAEPAGVLIPEVFGVKLGDGINNYPDMRESKAYDDGTVNYTRAEDEGKAFEGINTLGIAYSTYEGRVAGVMFTFESNDLNSMIRAISAKYGDRRWFETDLSMWEDDYFSISVEPYGSCHIVCFDYDPLVDKIYGNIFKIHELSYNKVCLNEQINKYKFMIPYIYFKPERKYAPGIMDYYRLFDEREFGEHTVTMYRTYRGIISTITVYFASERLGIILKILQKRYENIENGAFKRYGNVWSWYLGEYIIRVFYRPKEEYSIVEFDYQPLATQAEIAEREYLSR